MTKIYLIRHAEAEGNLYRRIHGQYESTVTYNGLRQIKALEDRFRDVPVDACYSSDLVRARTTAQAIWVPKRLPLRTDTRFREVNLGVWEDLPFGELDWRDPEGIDRFNNDPDHWHVEGGEDYPVLTARFLAAFDEVARRHDGQTVAIFTHGCVLRAVQRALLGGDWGAYSHCDNTGVSLLEWEDGACRAVYLNDNSHLPPEISTFARQSWWRQDGGGKRDHNLWFRPLDDPAWYIDCYRETWESLYGSAHDFSGTAYYRDALAGAMGRPEALCEAMLGEKRVGVVQLDVGRGAGSGVGWIAFLYLRPEYRRTGLGIQLVGHAVSFYRREGRTHLGLSVSPHNEAAVAFYRKYGFTDLGPTPGLYGDLRRMDFNFDLQRDLAPERAAADEHGQPPIHA